MKLVQVCISDGKRYAGPSGNAGPGSVIAVPEDEAKGLIAGGYAERVDSLPKYGDEPEPVPEKPKKETATSRGAKNREKAVETE